MSGVLAAVVAPGFFASGPVRVALAIGAIVAVVSGTVGVFTVIRGQAFAGEALADITTSGGSAAFLVGVAPLWAFITVALAAAGAMELAGVQRVRGRDLATGIVLGVGLGLAALFFYLDTVQTSASGTTVTILFGSIFTVSGSTVPIAAVCGGLTLAVLAALFRPLMLSSLSAELAAARGIPVRLVGVLYLVVTAAAVALAAITIGTILSTALLVGPAATALRLTRSPGRAVFAATLIGLLAIWLGVLLAYDSYYWPPAGHGWPVSFFVVALILGFYLLAGLTQRRLGAPELIAVFSGFMVNAWAAATIVAAVAGVVGFFTVLRGSAFAAHAIPNGSFAGAVGASLIAAPTLVGLGAFAFAGALLISLLGRRGRHDVATALSLVTMLALGALFVSWSTEYAPEIYSLFFGEVLGVSSSQLLPTAALGAGCIVAIAFLHRPLLLSSVLPDVARTRGLGSFRMELAFLTVVALATTMTVPVVGTMLIFALMIGPPAAARALTDRPLVALALSVAIALITAWSAIAAAYTTDYPVGFFVGVVSAGCYAAGRAWAASAGRRARSADPRAGAGLDLVSG